MTPNSNPENALDVEVLTGSIAFDVSLFSSYINTPCREEEEEEEEESVTSTHFQSYEFVSVYSAQSGIVRGSACCSSSNDILRLARVTDEQIAPDQAQARAMPYVYERTLASALLCANWLRLR